MAIAVRTFRPADRQMLARLDDFLAMALLYHGDYEEENILCAVDETGALAGVCCLYADRSGLLEGNADSVRWSNLYLSVPCPEALGPLLDGCVCRLGILADKAHTRRLGLCACCGGDERARQAAFLSRGFIMSGVIPLLRFDCAQALPLCADVREVRIHPVTLDEEGMRLWRAADALSAHGLAASAAELSFIAGAPGFHCYAAWAAGELVGGVTVCSLGEGQFATENLFVIPEYRRRGIARSLMCRALRDLKEGGAQGAVLSVQGTNSAALRLYHDIGYTLQGHLLEMRLRAWRQA